MEFGNIVMSRYATKKFDGKKIPEAKIDELLEMVRFAPSALNLQPWKIKVVTDQKPKISSGRLPLTRNRSPPVRTCLFSVPIPITTA